LARDLVDRIDGLLVPGGADISPSRYGQRKHKAHRPVHPRLESYWFEALAEADRRRMPILGICLGSQVLNVERGGTLVQDIPSQWPDPLSHRPEKGQKRCLHTVVVEPNTRLASIVGEGRFETNSSHHQASDKPGRGLVVSARATDGVIEALEDPGHPFYLSIQWHPEIMTARKKHLALFEAFVHAASAP
jgi:putative glutamine amidotransferase